MTYEQAKKMEKEPHYQGLFYCDVRDAFFRWADFITFRE